MGDGGRRGWGGEAGFLRAASRGGGEGLSRDFKTHFVLCASYI